MSKPSVESLKLFCVTVTGADELTSPRDLGRVQQDFPFVEWGILIYPGREGARYPSTRWIETFLDEVPHGHKALHACGEAVPQLLANDAKLTALAGRFGRVQLNFNQKSQPVDLDALERFIDRATYPVITQHCRANEAVTAAIKNPRHHILFDESSGKGASPDSWPEAIAGKICGWAGGHTADNIKRRLPLIAEAAGDHKFWVDGENGFRTPADTLDIKGRVEPFLRHAAAFMHVRGRNEGGAKRGRALV